MQTLALDKNVRVTFLGGDVHAGAVGRLYTQPKLQKLRYDHRMMVQVGTSWLHWAGQPPHWAPEAAAHGLLSFTGPVPLSVHCAPVTPRIGV